MSVAGPQIPTRFPRWCRAVYSWGGETKRDLGFVEGDLIECLNAGDGSWWTGRLQRDRRNVGLFPSNFVELLDESFTPAPISRGASVMSLQSKTPVQKSASTYRKPFQAYGKVGPGGSEGSSRTGTPDKETKKASWAPFSSMKTAQAPMSTLKKNGGVLPTQGTDGFRVPEPPARTVERMHSRAHSPAPMPARSRSPNPMLRAASPAIPRAASPANDHYRPTSPAPEQYRALSPAPLMYRAHSPSPPMDGYGQRSHNPHEEYRSYSPNPPQQMHDSKAPSPQPWKDDEYDNDQAPSGPFELAGSPLPPAPPPHRSAWPETRPSSPQKDDGHSPAPSHSQGMTPSPLRDAMNDVMSSLDDMSIVRQPSPTPKEPPSIWSPEAFGELQVRPQSRARSAMGFAARNNHSSGRDTDSNPSIPSSRDGQPQLSSYVQRMEQRLRHSKSTSMAHMAREEDPADGEDYTSRHDYAMAMGARRPESRASNMTDTDRRKALQQRKSAYELGRDSLRRTFTTKSSVTSSSSGWRSNTMTQSVSTQATSQSLMSKSSAGAISATSAGSMSRRKFGMGSLRRRPLSTVNSRGDLHDDYNMARPESAFSGPSYHSSHATQPGAITPVADWNTNLIESSGMLGGFSAPRAKKSGFFKKMMATAKTGAANARSTIGSAHSRPSSRAGHVVTRHAIPDGVSSISYEPEQPASSSAHRDMGLGGSDWMQVRRDVNRTNSLSRNERQERADRCQMLDIMVINPIEELFDQAEGDESLDGLPVSDATDFQQPSLALVDKSTRFVASLPSGCTPAMLATTYLCRPFRSDVQRLRAIFTWVSERITWEEDFIGDIETRRVIQTKRGCSEEIARLVQDLCVAVGLHAEVVQGFLKSPGEAFDADALSHPNHWWNTVLCDGEWRIMDCSLAGPTNPKRSQYTSTSGNIAESWWFLARPMEVCYTHVPCRPEQQHICPPQAPEVLLNLPCASPPYFKHNLQLLDFDTSALHLEGLELAHLKIQVPEDVECVAEVEARACARDHDGDLYETGEVVRKPAFAQAHWRNGRKVYVIKALLPGDEGTGVLKVYAGKRGLMHSITSNPHPLCLSLALQHSGANPPFDFHVRHPTPHAARHDLYVSQPQCARLVQNNTFVFGVEQHPSSSSNAAEQPPPRSASPFHRPASSMSLVSAASGGGSQYSNGSAEGQAIRPAKLAVQTPSGRIIRLTRKEGAVPDEGASAWETVVKVSEQGTWRGLVLADRSARWCVFAEWECI